MIELWQAIYSYFDTNTNAAALKAALTGGLHNLEAPQDVKFPFGTFQLISDTPDHFASDKNFTENCLVQFNLFSNKRSIVKLLGIYDELIACFDFLLLSISNYTTLSCVRQNTIQMRIEDVWQLNVTYRLMLEPS